MRTLVFGMAAALTFSPVPAAQPPVDTSSLAGRVVSGTGADAKPVRRARVTLTGRGQVAPRVTDTDAKGAYRCDCLPAGEFRVRVSAIPVEFDSAPIGGGPAPSETRDDLTFEVAKLSGLRQIFVSVSSPNFALKKITLNEMDITDTPIDFRTKDVEGVEVRLTPKVSRLSGVVSDDKGPIADYAVVIFASDSTRWIDRSRFVVTARPTARAFRRTRTSPRGLPGSCAAVREWD